MGDAAACAPRRVRIVLTDYHMHTQPDGVSEREGDDRGWERHGGPWTSGWIGEYVAVARSRAIDEIALTEHIHRFTCAQDWHTDPFWVGEATEDIATYVDGVRAAQSDGHPVLLGIEMDWLPDRRESISEVLADHPFDVVLGSVHWLGTQGIDDPAHPAADRMGGDHVWEGYLAEFARAALSGLFDVMAHPDLPKVFGQRLPSSMASRLDDMVGAVREAGIAIECSSAGLRKPVKEMYPDPDLLALFSQAGVPVTLASDAHRPADVGRDYATVVAAIRGAGYTTLTRFRGREARQEAFA